MANYKRGRPRTAPTHGRFNKWKQRELERSGRYYYWMTGWPRWWDIVFHRRPNRRANTRLEYQIRAGTDPDTIAWPLHKKPHIYYW